MKSIVSVNRNSFSLEYLDELTYTRGTCPVGNALLQEGHSPIGFLDDKLSLCLQLQIERCKACPTEVADRYIRQVHQEIRCQSVAAGRPRVRFRPWKEPYQ